MLYKSLWKINIIQPNFIFIIDGKGLAFTIFLEDIWLWHKSLSIFPFSSVCDQPFTSRLRGMAYVDKHLLLEAVFQIRGKEFKVQMNYSL